MPTYKKPTPSRPPPSSTSLLRSCMSPNQTKSRHHNKLPCQPKRVTL